MFNKWGNIFGGIISNGYGVLRDIETSKGFYDWEEPHRLSRYQYIAKHNSNHIH